MRFYTLAILPIIALAGCAAESRQAPISTAGPGGGSAQSEPESANSLPLGSAVSEPLTGPVGNVGTTRVGPGRAAPPPRNR